MTKKTHDTDPAPPPTSAGDQVEAVGRFLWDLGCAIGGDKKERDATLKKYVVDKGKAPPKEKLKLVKGTTGPGAQCQPPKPTDGG